MLYIIDGSYNMIKTFNLIIDGVDYEKKAVNWCVENRYELVTENRNSLGDLFWTVKKM